MTRILAAFLFLPLAALPAHALTWESRHFSTGTSFNHTLAVADLNGDGKLDVATPNSQAGAVTVLLGNGDGTLASFTSWATFSEPQDVAIADLTGDGIADLATADYTSGGVTLLRGLGDGTFATRTLLPAGSGLIALVPVDLDGDGRVDLAISKESGSKLVVLPALAGGGFGTPVETSTGATPHQLAAADLDHDGKVDLAVVANGAAAVSVHLGDGGFAPGAATPFAAGVAPIGITVADLNGDGDLDLVVSNVNAPAISVLLGNGDGTFAAPVAYPTDPRPRGMDSGDLDGDGVPDVVVATGYPDGDSVLTVFRGAGDGTLVLDAHVRLPYRAADCVIADMDGDGRRDVVATGPQAGVVTVLRNVGTVSVPVEPARSLALEVRPNPARAATTFTVSLPPATRGTLEVFDTAGRRVAAIPLTTGGTFTWRGTGAHGQPLSAGVYLARLAAGGAAVTKRFVLLAR